MNSIFLFCLALVHFSGIYAADSITDQEIQYLYDTYVSSNFTHEYKYRYVPLPLEKNIHSWRWEGKDFPRVIALLEFERFVKENTLSSSNGLAINGFDPEWEYVPHKYVKETDYVKDPNTYDLHTLNLDQKDFDFVMLNQTLEHLQDPIGCLKNVYNHMKEGGILYINVPANSILHSIPYHYYTGYTPIGLAVLTKLAGFQILHVGQWGTLEYLHLMQKNQSWPDYTQLVNPGLNEFEYPVITWVFAKK